ncbi:MAG: TetR/AcrR family transcriptional regulator [Chitinophagaceae bacterium]|nr:TetR/AcrR family transcriptional regulator [Oligoflexus sp.]
MTVELGTKQKAIREGNALVQKFGCNGFSFQHIADTLGIKKPSLYAHFESKEAFGLDMIEFYRQWLAGRLGRICERARTGAENSGLLRHVFPFCKQRPFVLSYCESFSRSPFFATQYEKTFEGHS